MMFLIEYDRHKGRIVSLRDFSDADRRRAEGLRLEMELELNRRGVNHEVVLLEASSEDALRRTHRRYFESFRQIIDLSLSNGYITCYGHGNSDS